MAVRPQPADTKMPDAVVEERSSMPGAQSCRQDAER